MDPDNVGTQENWWREDHDDSAWREIHIGRALELQGISYYGYEWYRIPFTVPPEYVDAKLTLHFGAVSYEPAIWVNDRYVGEYFPAYAEPVEFDLTGFVRPGKNLLAIRLRDWWGGGGIWKAMTIHAPRLETSPEEQ
jgi:beta-galactosidase/beta-glucuronidase